jgi:hypothetical protein
MTLNLSRSRIMIGNRRPRLDPVMSCPKTGVLRSCILFSSPRGKGIRLLVPLFSPSSVISVLLCIVRKSGSGLVMSVLFEPSKTWLHLYIFLPPFQKYKRSICDHPFFPQTSHVLLVPTCHSQDSGELCDGSLFSCFFLLSVALFPAQLSYILPQHRDRGLQNANTLTACFV